MSRANVEIAKRAMDAFNRRDSDSYDDLVTEDFEWPPGLGAAVEGGGSYVGREGMETFLGEVLDTWEEFRLFADDFRDLGDRVLVLCRTEGRGRGSGVPVNAREAMLCDFREGKISRIRNYLDQGEALRAAGLDEGSG